MCSTIWLDLETVSLFTTSQAFGMSVLRPTDPQTEHTFLNSNSNSNSNPNPSPRSPASPQSHSTYRVQHPPLTFGSTWYHVAAYLGTHS